MTGPMLAVLLCVLVGVFVSREFWLWYLRINRMIDYLEAQTRLLKAVHDELVAFRNERNRFRKTA